MKTIKFFLLLAVNAIILSVAAQPAAEKINLTSGGNALDAYFYNNPGESKPTVILLHGLPGNNSSPLDLAENLSKSGLKILVFNYSGSYASDGYFSSFNCIKDLDAAINWLKQPQQIAQYGIDTSRIIVCGYSFGGCVVLSGALQNPAIKNIVSIAGLDQSVSLKEMAGDSVKQAAFAGRNSGMFAPAGPLKSNPDIPLKMQVSNMISRVDDFDLVKYADRLKDRNILFIAGWLDTATPIETNLLPLYRKLSTLGAENISISTFNSGHRFNDVRPEIAATIATWISSLNP